MPSTKSARSREPSAPLHIAITSPSTPLRGLKDFVGLRHARTTRRFDRPCEDLEHRAVVAGCGRHELTGPLFASRTGRRLTPKAVWVLVRRTAGDAGIASWSKLSPHSLRHTAITLALDAGAPLRDVHDFAGHRDARTTRRYDRAREDLDRSPTYAARRPTHVTESP